jgi:protein-disulfide isomerase-like protein with CxxC motif
MTRIGAAGFPAACVETATHVLRPVVPQEFLGRPEAFVQRLRETAAA